MAEWTRICELEEIPALGARVLRAASEDIAVFRSDRDEVFALHDRCPHKGGPLSQGIVHGAAVTCPLHNWRIDLRSGAALAPDRGCARAFPVKLVDGWVLIALGSGSIADERSSGCSALADRSHPAAAQGGRAAARLS